MTPKKLINIQANTIIHGRELQPISQDNVLKDVRDHSLNKTMLKQCIYRYTYIFNSSQILLSIEINPCKLMLHEENKEIKEVKFDLQQVFYLPDDKESDIHDIPPVGSLEFYFPP